MPAYNFKTQFADKVEIGEKLNTIRPKRKRPTVKGDELMLYTAQRTTDCRILRKTTCTDVKPVEIRLNDTRAGCVVIDGKVLSVEEIEKLARSDGFDSSADFFKFFTDTYDLTPEKPLVSMELICWK